MLILFPRQNPGKLVPIVPEVEHARAGNGGESGCGRRIECLALHFDRADEIAGESRFEPQAYPLEKRFGITDDIGAEPVHRTYVRGLERESVMLHPLDAGKPHDGIFQGRPVYGEHLGAQLGERPSPSTRA